MTLQDQCKQFWVEKTEYPVFGPNIRRFHELSWLVPRVKGKSLMDLGCGDGTFLRLLDMVTDIKRFYGYDISPNLLSKVDKRVYTKVYDATNPKKLPKTDILIMNGLLIYILDDFGVNLLLSKVNSKQIFIKCPCVNKRLLVTTDSKQVGKGYVACYRTLNELVELIGKRFDVVETGRVYPDEIESKFGSKQYYIWAEAKK